MAKIIVIGAGIAGLAAASTLINHGHSVKVIEARDRLGGRTHTRRDFADFPIEFGAEFIHGSHTSTYAIAKRLNLAMVQWKKFDDSLVWLDDGSRRTMAEARKNDANFERVRSWNLPEVKFSTSGESLASYLRRCGYNETQLQYVRRMFGNATGEDPELIDAEAALHDVKTYASDDYKLLGGYDMILQDLAAGVDVRLNSIVNEIKWNRSGITVSVNDGTSESGDFAVLTVPVGVLSSGTIKFSPKLTRAKTDALAKVVMGPVAKIILRLDQQVADPGVVAIFANGNPPMWWSPTFGRESAKDIVWSAFFSGRWARELLADGEASAIDKAVTTLRNAAGNDALTPLAAAVSDWPADPFSRGGYSVCLPGGFGARAELATPTPPLFWAGEATGPSSTVHAAFDSGLRVVEEINSLVSKSVR